MLIAVAGNTPTSPFVTDTVEIYDLSTPKKNWSPATNFPLAVSGYRGVTLDNIFYVTGKT